MSIEIAPTTWSDDGRSQLDENVENEEDVEEIGDAEKVIRILVREYLCRATV